MRAILFCILTLIVSVAHAGNFAVSARDVEFARQVGTVAETSRRDLAIEWLGYELPPWPQRCPIYVVDGEHLGAAGETSFMFGGGTVGNWNMQVQGSRQRILDSVVPHEVMHTVLASHFKQQLPRWLDEGSCSSIEDGSQRNRLQVRLIDFLKTQRGIPFDAMFAMREYPNDILPLYAQGHSVCTFLQQHDSKPHFVSFVTAGLRDRSWSGAVEQYYGYRGLGELQQTWLDWVKAGSPLASNSQVVTVNRLFGGCRLRWDPGRRIFIRQCQPPRQAQPVVAQPRPTQPAPRQPATQSPPASQPPTDINDLPPVAQASPPQTQQSASGDATCGPCNLTPIVVAIEGIQKELANLKLAKGPKGDPGENGPQGEQGPAGPPGQAGANGKDGKDADDAKLLELEANFASLKLQVNQLQAGADKPLIVNIMDTAGTVLDHKEIYISKGQPLNLELQPVPVSAPIGAAAPASAP